jgi:hypothetical protein
MRDSARTPIAFFVFAVTMRSLVLLEATQRLSLVQGYTFTSLSHSPEDDSVFFAAERASPDGGVDIKLFKAFTRSVSMLLTSRYPWTIQTWLTLPKDLGRSSARDCRLFVTSSAAFCPPRWSQSDRFLQIPARKRQHLCCSCWWGHCAHMPRASVGREG